MTYTMSADVYFPESRGRRGFGIRRVNEIHTEKSWKEFTGTAEIVIPRNVKDFNKIEADNLFLLGDPVSIKFGYGSDIPTEFDGYITDVSDGIPYRIKCEDEMFVLKRGSFSLSQKGINLKALLEKIAPSYEIECTDIEIGTVRYANVAPVTILDNLKKELGIYSYFKGKTLYSVDGNSQSGKLVKIVLERNAVSEDLNKKTKADEKILIKFKSLQRNGQYVTHEEGDPDGTVQVRSWPYLTKAEIEARAKRIAYMQKNKGFDGTITLFGIPMLNVGDRIEFGSLFYKHINGTFYVDKIVKSFSKSGIRQQVTIGNKVE